MNTTKKRPPVVCRQHRTSEIWYSAGGTSVNTLTYSCDNADNRLTARDDDGVYTNTYDKLNRATVQKDIFGQTSTFAFDTVGNRTALQDSLGGRTTSVYNAVHLLTQRNSPATAPRCAWP